MTYDFSLGGHSSKSLQPFAKRKTTETFLAVAHACCRMHPSRHCWDLEDTRRRSYGSFQLYKDIQIHDLHASTCCIHFTSRTVLHYFVNTCIPIWFYIIRTQNTQFVDVSRESQSLRRQPKRLKKIEWTWMFPKK